MKILVTGFVSSHVSGKRNTLKYFPTPNIVDNTLRMLGHEVVRAPITAGDESIYGYDRIIMYVATINSITTRFGLGATWAISRVPEKIIFALNDWQVASIESGIKSVARNPDLRLWAEGKSPRFQEAFKTTRWRFEESLKHRDEITAQVLKMAASKDWGTVIMPIFPWGDVSKVRVPFRKRIPIDLTPGLPLYPPSETPPEKRRREWICATLMDRRKWIDQRNLSWPVVRYGVKKTGDERLVESDLAVKYGEAWGAMSPIYTNQIGSGWFRARFAHVANADAIMLTDPRDCQKMGAAYRAVAAKPRYVEGFSAKDLVGVAREQRDWFFNNTWTMERLRAELSEIIA